MTGNDDSLDDDRDPWYAEAEAIELDTRDFDVAEAAELPLALSHHVTAAELDDDFEIQRDEWLEKLYADIVTLLVLEQCCAEGVLLPWDMRGARLLSAPQEAIGALHQFWGDCPRHVVVHIAHYVFWLMRAERSRRRGTPHWTPQSALPPAVEDSAFFRPPRLKPRPYSG